MKSHGGFSFELFFGIRNAFYISLRPSRNTCKTASKSQERTWPCDCEISEVGRGTEECHIKGGRRCKRV